MHQLAHILTDGSTSTQAQVVGTADPPSPTPSAGKFRYLSYYYAKRQLAAIAGGRGAALRALDLYQELKHLADRAGHVRTTNDQLAKLLKVKSRTTVFSAAKRLVQAGLIDPPRRTYDRRGYVNGLVFTVRFDPAYVQLTAQQELPFKSRNSSARGAPRPPDPATRGQVRLAAFTVTDPLRTEGHEAPDNRPDQVEAVRTLLTERRMTATDAEIHAALDFVAQYRRAQQLRLAGLIGVVARPPRQAPAGAADRSLNAAWAQYWAARETA